MCVCVCIRLFYIFLFSIKLQANYRSRLSSLSLSLFSLETAIPTARISFDFTARSASFAPKAFLQLDTHTHTHAHTQTFFFRAQYLSFFLCLFISVITPITFYYNILIVYRDKNYVYFIPNIHCISCFFLRTSLSLRQSACKVKTLFLSLSLLVIYCNVYVVFVCIFFQIYIQYTTKGSRVIFSDTSSISYFVRFLQFYKIVHYILYLQ